MPRRSEVKTIWDLAAPPRREAAHDAPPIVKRRRRDLVEHWKSSIAAYLSGVDETTTDVSLPDGTVHHFPKGRPLVWTKDEADEARPEKPFPSRREMPHVYAMAEELLDSIAKITGIDKVRQVLATLTVAQCCTWFCATKRNRSVVWSKITEDEAVRQVEDKIRAPWRMLPDWVKREWPMSMSPLNRADFKMTGSLILAVPQNAASGKVRGITASIAVIDEAAFQPFTGDILAAVKPMRTRVWCLSTPNVGQDAVAFRSIVDLPTIEAGKDYKIPGFEVRWVSSNTKVIHVDHIAIPARRDVRWWDALIDLYKPLGDRDPSFRRENRRDWTVGTGKGYFAAEFIANGGPERYMLPVNALHGVPIATGTVHRGRDFGERRPACIWLQAVTMTHGLADGGVVQFPRILVLFEWLGDHISVYDARDVTLFLSGQLDIKALGRGAKEELERIKGMQGDPWPAPPWFRPHRCNFEDWGSYEATDTSDKVDTHSTEKTDAAIFEARGVHLNMFFARPAAMGRVMRLLLRDLPDGLPGILISPYCKLVLGALGGGLEYKKPTESDPAPEVWRKDGVNDNIMEALMHAVVNLVSEDDLNYLREREAVERAGLVGRSSLFAEGRDWIRDGAMVDDGEVDDDYQAVLD